jgi:DNA-binding PadR family transcriptional regulator
VIFREDCSLSYVECMVLGLLNEGFTYGHELDRVLDERSMRYWTKLTRRSIYSALKRLTEKGWVHSHTDRKGNMPEQIRYALTDEGKSQLHKMIEDGLATTELVRFDYSIPIALMYVIPRAVAIEKLTARRDWVGKFVHEIPPAQDDENPELRIEERANVRLLRSYYLMEFEWLNWVIDELHKPQNPNISYQSPH